MSKMSIVFESENSEEQNIKTLPPLYTIDSKGKRRLWKCWVIDDTVYREHGLIDGKKVSSERTFEGKNIGKKNETSPEEQAWNEANKEWVAHIDKEYAPDKTDKEGLSMMRKLIKEKEKTGGHNINSVATTTSTKNNTNDNNTVKTTAKAVKNVSRKKTDTCMVDEIIGGPIIPMKAETWELADESDPHSVLPKVSKYFMEVTGKGKNAVTHPTDLYLQGKIDGWRCRVALQRSTNDTFEIVMTSNSGKQYPWFSSLRDCFIKWLTSKKINMKDLLDGLDGELYATEFYDETGNLLDPLTRFSTVCSICALARSAPHDLEDQIQFHCFDLIDKSGEIPQHERFASLYKLFKQLPPDCEKRIIRVETHVLSDISEIPDKHNKYVEEGYEGVILRAYNMKYKVGKRNAEMRKFKYFKDEEYEIVGCKVDKGVSKEHFVWVLKNDDGKEFSAKPMGTREQKLKWYKNEGSYIGRFMTVKFQEFTDNENKIPRFPIAKHFRAGKGVD
jgi:hypothetical protein